MKNMFKYIIFLYLIINISLLNVNAECSYQERKELLNYAKNVDAYFELDNEVNKFKMNLFNINDNLYIEVENNGVITSIDEFSILDGKYSFYDDNIDDVIIFKVNVYSKHSNCYGQLMYSKRVTKPMVNKHSKEDYCKGIEDYYYCNRVINKKTNLTDKDIKKRIMNYREKIGSEQKEEEQFNFLLLLRKYWYVFVVILFIIMLVPVIIYINKKRGEL